MLCDTQRNLESVRSLALHALSSHALNPSPAPASQSLLLPTLSPFPAHLHRSESLRVNRRVSSFSVAEDGDGPSVIARMRACDEVDMDSALIQECLSLMARATEYVFSPSFSSKETQVDVLNNAKLLLETVIRHAHQYKIQPSYRVGEFVEDLFREFRALSAKEWNERDQKMPEHIQSIRKDIVQCAISVSSSHLLSLFSMQSLVEVFDSAEIDVFSGLLLGLTRLGGVLIPDIEEASLFFEKLYSFCLRLLSLFAEDENFTSTLSSLLDPKTRFFPEISDISVSEERFFSVPRSIDILDFRKFRIQRQNLYEFLNSFETHCFQFFTVLWDWSHPPGESVEKLFAMCRERVSVEDIFAACGFVQLSSPSLFQRVQREATSCIKLISMCGLYGPEEISFDCLKLLEDLISSVSLFADLDEDGVVSHAFNDSEPNLDASRKVDDNAADVSFSTTSCGQIISELFVSYVDVRSRSLFDFSLELFSDFLIRSSTHPFLKQEDAIRELVVCSALRCVEMERSVSNSSIVANELFLIKEAAARALAESSHSACSLIDLYARVSAKLLLSGKSELQPDIFSALSFFRQEAKSKPVFEALYRSFALLAPVLTIDFFESLLSHVFQLYDFILRLDPMQQFIVLRLVPTFLERLCTSSLSLEKRSLLFDTTLRLFNKSSFRVLSTIGFEFEELQGESKSYLVSCIGVLLPSIAHLFSVLEISEIFAPALNLRVLFRNLWTYCVLFCFTEEGNWREDWYSACCRIACFAPLLCGFNDPVSQVPVNTVLAFEFELQTLLGTLPRVNSLMERLRTNVAQLAQLSTRSLVRDLSSSHVLYLYCTYRLESLRALTNGSLATLFHYLDDIYCNSVESLRTILNSIVETILDEYLSRVVLEMSLSRSQDHTALHPIHVSVRRPFTLPIQSVELSNRSFICRPSILPIVTEETSSPFRASVQDHLAHPFAYESVISEICYNILPALCGRLSEARLLALHFLHDLFQRCRSIALSSSLYLMCSELASGLSQAIYDSESLLRREHILSMSSNSESTIAASPPLFGISPFFARSLKSNKSFSENIITDSFSGGIGVVLPESDVERVDTLDMILRLISDWSSFVLDASPLHARAALGRVLLATFIPRGREFESTISHAVDCFSGFGAICMVQPDESHSFGRMFRNYSGRERILSRLRGSLSCSNLLRYSLLRQRDESLFFAGYFSSPYFQTELVPSRFLDFSSVVSSAFSYLRLYQEIFRRYSRQISHDSILRRARILPDEHVHLISDLVDRTAFLLCYSYSQISRNVFWSLFGWLSLLPVSLCNLSVMHHCVEIWAWIRSFRCNSALLSDSLLSSLASSWKWSSLQLLGIFSPLEHISQISPHADSGQSESLPENFTPFIPRPRSVLVDADELDTSFLVDFSAETSDEDEGGDLDIDMLREKDGATFRDRSDSPSVSSSIDGLRVGQSIGERLRSRVRLNTIASSMHASVIAADSSMLSQSTSVLEEADADVKTALSLIPSAEPFGISPQLFLSVEDLSCHRLVFKFFIETVDSISLSAGSSFLFLVDFAENCLDRDKNLCPAGGAKHCRLLMFSFCIRVLGTLYSHRRRSRMQSLLSALIFNMAEFFSSCQSWTPPTEYEDMYEYLELLVEICQFLRIIVDIPKKKSGLDISPDSSVETGQRSERSHASAPLSTRARSISKSSYGLEWKEYFTESISRLIDQMDMNSSKGIGSRSQVLLSCFQHHLDSVCVWLEADGSFSKKRCPSSSRDFRSSELPMEINDLISYAEIARQISLEFLISFADRFSHRYDFQHVVIRMVERDPFDFVTVPSAIRYLCHAVARSEPDRSPDEFSFTRYIAMWRVGSMAYVLPFLNRFWFRSTYVQQYVVRCLRSHSETEISFLLPQLVQMLRYDHLGLLSNHLRLRSVADEGFLLSLMWTLNTVETATVGLSDAPTRLFYQRCFSLRSSIESSLGVKKRDMYLAQNSLIASILQVSSELRQVPKGERKIPLLKRMERVPFPREVFFPLDPKYEIIDIVRDQCVPMQSAAKAPILVPLLLRQSGSGSEERKACIFKTHDDCRNDQLVVQIINFFKDLFEAHDLPLTLVPYRVLPTSHDSGIIEVVPRCKSRDQLGNVEDGALYEYFVRKHGHPHSRRFAEVRRNFLRSLAAYSVVSYILNIKDRHNGNILIHEDGFLIHIDFGFVFDRYPGGEFRFERAPFKLTKEMMQILGNPLESATLDSEHAQLFMEYCVRGFLVARQHTEEIISLVRPIFESGMECFKPNSLENLRDRFKPQLNAHDAAAWMRSRVDDSYNAFSTKLYDTFQRMLEGVNY